MSDHYIPGTCNIGKSEIRRRQFFALIGAVATIFGAISIVHKYHSQAPRLVIFIPAMIFATGWVQSRKKFCFAYGIAGLFNFGKAGHTEKIQSKDDLAADRAMAFSILRQSALLAFAITGLIFFLPF